MLLSVAVLACYLAPRVPAVQSWLLAEVRESLAEAGYRVGFAGSGGNLWRYVELEHLSISAAGLELELEQLRVDYFLPSLLAGDLPLSVTASGLDGSVTLAELQAPPDAAGRQAIRPVLRSLDIREVALEVDDIGYTLPDLAITELNVFDVDDALRFESSLRTRHGAAQLQGTVALEPFTLAADIVSADAAIARQWWAGAIAGTVSGDIDVRDGQLSATLKIDHGIAELAGIRFSDVSGTARYHDLEVHAELAGLALGGEVSGTGVVDIAERSWRADAYGDPALSDAAAWLAAGRVPVDPAELDLTGSAAVALTATGWESVAVTGQAEGQGTLLGQPLALKPVDFDFTSELGTRVRADAGVLGGTMRVSLHPTGHGFASEIRAAALRLGGLRADLAFDLSGADGELTGAGLATARGELAQRRVELSADARLDGDALRLFLAGADELGAALSGAAVLDASGLDAAVSAVGVELPLFDTDADLTLSARGPWSRLDLELDLDAEQPLHLSTPGAQLAGDFRGRAAGSLEATRLTILDGVFGNLAVAGELDLVQRTGEAQFALADTSLQGRYGGTLELHEGTVSLSDRGVALRAQVDARDLSYGPLVYPRAAGSLEVSTAGGVELGFASSEVDLHLDDGTLTGTLASSALLLAGEPAIAGGSFALERERGLAGFEGELSARLDDAELTLMGRDGLLDLSLTAAPGLSLGTMVLHERVQLSATLQAMAGELEVSGALGDIDLAAAGRLDGETAWTVAGSLQSQSDRLAFEVDDSSWQLAGEMPLAPFASLFGLQDLSGSFASDLAAGSQGYRGALRAQTQLAGEPLYLTVEGLDQVLELRAQTRQLGETLRFEGTLVPELGGDLNLGRFGGLTLAGGDLANLSAAGEGKLPPVTRLGLSIEPQPWALTAELASRSAELRAGGSTLVASWHDGLQASLSFDQVARYRGGTVVLRGEADYGAAAPTGQVEGELAIATDASQGRVQFGGSAEAVDFKGAIPAQLVAGLMGVQEQLLAGDVALQGQLRPLRGDATLSAGWQGLELEATADSEGARATVTGDGLALAYDRRQLAVEADGYRLAPLAGATRFDAVLDGALSRGVDGGWQGNLELSDAEHGSASLTGRGDTLHLDASVRADEATIHAHGTLHPAPQLEVSAAARHYPVRVDGTLSGPWPATALSGTVHVGAWQVPALDLATPERTAEVFASLEEGPVVRVGGDGIEGELIGGRLNARLDLDVELKSQAHDVRVTLHGEAAAPALEATVTGPYLAGTVAAGPTSVNGSLKATADPWLPRAVRGAIVEVSVDGTGLSDWQAGVRAQAGLYADDRSLPLGLRGSLRGSGLTVDGQGELALAGETLAVHLSRDTGGARLTLESDGFDVAGVASLLPVEVSGVVRGLIELTATPDLDLSLGATADLKVRDEQLTFSLDAHRDRGVSAGGSYGSTRFSVTGPLATDGPFDVEIQDDARDLLVAGAVAIGGPWAVELAGHVAGQPAQLDAALSGDGAEGSLSAEVAGLVVDLQLRDGLLAGALAATGESLVPMPLEASLDGRLTEAGVDIDRLRLHTHLLSEPAELALEGRIGRELTLTGTLSSGLLEQAVEVALDRHDSGYAWRLADGSLELSGLLSAALRPTRLSLTGEGSYSRPGLELSSNLGWSDEQGYAGAAYLSWSATPDVTVEGTLNGSGELVARGEVRSFGVQPASFELTMSPDLRTDPEVSGLVSLAVGTSALLPGWPGEELTLSGELLLGGSLSDPHMEGRVALTGPLTASGELSGDLSGAMLSFGGPGLALAAAIDRSGYNVDAQLERVDIQGLLPQVESLTASMELRAAQAWGTSPLLELQGIDLRAGASRVTGLVTLADGLTGQLQLAVDLGDLALPAPYQGVLEGPVRLHAAPGEQLQASGSLTAQRVGPAGAGWSLSGNGRIDGAASDPQLDLALTGEGSASGKLQASLAPAQGRYLVKTDLQVAGFRSDASIELADGRAAAQGTFSWGDLIATVETSWDGRLVVAGDGRLVGWRAESDGMAQRIDVTGDLKTLADSAAGSLTLVLEPFETTWLRGELEGGSYGEVDIGALILTGDTLPGGRQVQLDGKRLQAIFELTSNGAAWTVERLELPVTTGFGLSMAGAGDLNRARLTGDLYGDLGGERLELPFALDYRDDAVTLHAESELLAGDFRLAAAFEPGSGWQGDVSVTDVDFRGARATLDGRISGALADPSLQATLRADYGPLVASGSITAGIDELHVEQLISSDWLSESLTATGSLYPTFELTFAGGGDSLRLSAPDGRLQAEGELSIGLAGATLDLAGGGGDAVLGAGVALGLPGLALHGVLPQMHVADIWNDFQRDGLTLYGVQSTHGHLTLTAGEGLIVSSSGLSYRTEAGELGLAGSARLAGGLVGEFDGRWQGNPAGRAEYLPWLAAVEEVPFTVTLAGERGSLRSQSGLGTVEAAFDATGSGPRLDLRAALSPGGGAAVASVSFVPGRGPKGELTLERVPVAATPLRDETRIMNLTGRMQLAPEGISGSGSVLSEHGGVRIDGRVGWERIVPSELRAELFPLAGSELYGTARLDTFDLSELPIVERYAPHLQAPLTGIAQVQDGIIAGQLVSPNLTIADTQLPFQLEFNGDLSRLELRAELAQSRLNLTAENGELAGLMNFDRFPLQVLAEALVGDSGTDAHLTGVARIELPLDRPADMIVRVASERLTLEREGIVTTGEVAIRYQDRILTVERAEFAGAGNWSARGEFGPERLDLRFDARDADFSPLLSLAPQLAHLSVGAYGTVSLEASGSPQAARVELTSPELDVAVGGTEFTLQQTRLTLKEGALDSTSRLVATAPVAGTLELTGSGDLSLLPLEARDLVIGFAGSAGVANFGEVTDISGGLRLAPDGVWRLKGEGAMGNRLELDGTLNPLDLRLSGTGVNVTAPNLFLASSDTDVALRLVHDDAFRLSGEVVARSARLVLGQREVAVSGPQAGERSNLEGFVFDDVRIRAPQQIRVQESIGTAELGLDVVLFGTAAQPLLSGEARALRGTFTFAGREFRVGSAVANFEPTRGIYPTIAVHAAASFDKSRVLGRGAERVEFIAPREGTSFDVHLDIRGEFEDLGDGTHRLDLTPTLSSDAVIQEAATHAGAVAGTGPRSLSEEELVALLTVGRLELGRDLIGQDGVAGTVAQTALDTAVDLLVLAELQSALGEALGLELFEIRTTSLGALLESNGEAQFGVALRMGGYVSEDLFASFRIGSFDDANGTFALANRFSLRYDLAPVQVTLTGGLNFLTESFYAVPEFGLSLGYAVTPLTSFEAGLHLAGTRQSFGFGIGFRW